jgi:hypothetical protein
MCGRRNGEINAFVHTGSFAAQRTGNEEQKHVANEFD